MKTTKRLAIVSATLVCLSWIASVDSHCYGCGCNIIGCNCDCHYKAECRKCSGFNCPRWVGNGAQCLTLMSKRSIPEEIDPRVYFDRIDTNKVINSLILFFFK